MNDDETIATRSANPYASAQVATRPTTTAVANTDQQRAVAEVQAAMMIARANPRDVLAATDRILNACTRPTLATAAVYSYARGGQDISGPSIRLAEAMAQCWGNMQFGIRELEQRPGESTVQAFAWDVETNTRREVTFHVSHVRHTKRGRTMLEDPRDIYEVVANQGARRLRACIIAVIPGDVTEAAVAQCTATTEASADTSPEGIAKMLRVFEKLGVSRAQIEAFIQRHVDAIRPAQVVRLAQIATSIRDGMSVSADWFDPLPTAGGAEPEPTSGAEKVKAAIKERNAKAGPLSPTSPPFDLQAALAKINGCADPETRALIVDEMCSVLPDGPDRDAVTAAYRARSAEAD
jgi:hypothetical protein